MPQIGSMNVALRPAWIPNNSINGLDPSIQQFTSPTGFDLGMAAPSNPGGSLIPTLPGSPQQAIPPTGLIGSEQAIQQGLSGQLGLLAQGIGSAQGEIDLATGQARQDIAGGFNPAIGSVQQGFQQAARGSLWGRRCPARGRGVGQHPPSHPRSR